MKLICGIAGFVHKNNCSSSCFEIEELSHKNQCTRGPDNHGSWVHRGTNFTVHLFHERLRIQDLSDLADQPFHSENSENIHLVYNGEIYNTSDAKKALVPNIFLKTHSDTQILTEALARHNTINVLNNIRGMFAIGKFDSKNETLELIRDFFGEKPLHYAYGEDFILFASQFDTVVDSLKRLGLTPELDQISIYRYLILGYFPLGSSLFKNVFKVPPGSLLRFELNSERGYTPEISRWSPEWIAKSQENSSHKQLESTLASAVSEQLIGDVPIGVFLSGGVDSTLISALAQKYNSKPIHSFSVGFPESEFDESKYASAASSEIGTHHHSLVMAPEDAAEILPDVLRAFPEPLGDPSVFPTIYISREAKKHVTVVLTGDGADELFFGYGRYKRFIELQKLKFSHKIFFRVIQTFLFNALTKNLKINNRFERARQALSEISDIDTYISLVGFTQYRSASNTELFESTLKNLKRELVSSHLFIHPEKVLREIDVKTYLVDNILVKVDRAGMAFGLETRAPFLDKRIAELSASAPIYWLVNKEQKHVLKVILSAHVSEKIFRRSKMGFGAPIGGWFRTSLKSWGSELTNTFDWQKIGVDSKYVVKLWEENQKSSDNSATYLWILLSLASSVERFS